MKKQLISVLVAAGMFFSTMALAQTQTPVDWLPTGLVNSVRPSLDRQTMNDLMARAQTEKKSLVLEVGAAWCGPCTSFAMDLDQHPEDLKALSDAGYIFAKVEAEKTTETLLDTLDFMPGLLHFFPTFYRYVPGMGWKFIGSAASFVDLNLLLQSSSLPTLSVADMPAVIDAMGTAESSASPTAQAEQFAVSTNNISSLYSYNDAKAILALFRAENAKYPNLQLGDMADEYQQLFMPDYLAMGAVSFEVFAQDFPTTAAAMTDVSNENFSDRLFKHAISAVYRQLGPAGAQQQCDSVWRTLRSRLVKGTLSDADFQAKLVQMDNDAVFVCADLELQLTGPTESLKQTVLQAMTKGETDDWTLLASLGDVADAIKIYSARFQDFQKSYGAAIADSNKDLAAAQAAGDQNQIAQITQTLQLLNFMRQNHANVDHDVETALQAGKPVPAVKVFN